MRKILSILLIAVLLSCQQDDKKLTAQQIIDKSIVVSGGELHETTAISFDFRGRKYTSKKDGRQKVLERLLRNDATQLRDILKGGKFQRFQNDSLVVLSDSLSQVYANAVNSVHYFSKLPYQLNDPAVNKELLGEVEIKNKNYYKVKVTFDQEGGGDDFDDTYLYWIDKESFKADYLAYIFQVNGGGMRFREAYNERYIGGIRFVDYYNMKPKHSGTGILEIDSLYVNDQLQLLSKIELENISILVPGSYN